MSESKTISYTAAIVAFLVSAGSAGASTFDFGVTATDTAGDPISALAVITLSVGGLGLQLENLHALRTRYIHNQPFRV